MMKRKRYSQLVYDDIQKNKVKQEQSKRREELRKKLSQNTSVERQKSEWRSEF